MAFQPGQSGNPAGRPPGSKNLTTKVKEALEKIAEENGEETTYEKQLVRRILDKAINEGNDRMIQLIWNYIDGMPRQEIENTGDLTVRVVSYADGDNPSAPVQP